LSEWPLYCSVTHRESPVGAPGAPVFPQPLPLAGRKASNKMKWLQKLIERSRKNETKSEPKVESRPDALRIQELEARIAPNAIWGE
jgi:hypothetical protein